MEERGEYSVRRIMEIIEKLRGPGGCPWDRRQTMTDVGSYLIDEVYELIDEIDRGSWAGMKEELGDVLFQVLFLTQMAEEEGQFTFSDVADGVSEKMIFRHPHVFQTQQDIGVEEVRLTWERIKNRERGRGEHENPPIDAVPRSMPPLRAARKITGRAARLGFDWEETAGVVEKIEEELGELREAIAEQEQRRIDGEIGDLFLSLVNLCRFAGTDPEDALRLSMGKFVARFSYIEERLKEKGMSPQGATMEEMDLLWNAAKEAERNLENG